MGETSRALVMFAALVAGISLGWFGRGWLDGSDVSAKDSATQSQGFVTAGAKATTTINDAQAQADKANERVRESIKIRYVDKACPPGTGAVSEPVSVRLRAEFSQAGAR